MPAPRSPRDAHRLAAVLACLALPALVAATWPPGRATASAPERPQAFAALQSRPAAAPRPRPGWGAVYAGGSSYGLAVNRADRAEALRSAEVLCGRQGGGEGCRLVSEFAGRCGAVAQAVDREVLVALRPLGPASVRATAAGAGETQEQAQRAAQEACSRRGEGVCIVVAAACNGD